MSSRHNHGNRSQSHSQKPPRRADASSPSQHSRSSLLNSRGSRSFSLSYDNDGIGTSSGDNAVGGQDRAPHLGTVRRFNAAIRNYCDKLNDKEKSVEHAKFLWFLQQLRVRKGIHGIGLLIINL
jgi:hypothetical protein